MANIVIGELNIKTDELIKAVAETKKHIEDLEKQQDLLTQSGKRSSQQFAENSSTLKEFKTNLKEQTAALTQQQAVNEAVEKSVRQRNTTENEYLDNTRALITLKQNLNITDANYQERLANINAKLRENNNWINENGSANARLITTMSAYKDQVTESFNSINIFNGGLSGLVSRAQEAGGTGPLLKGAFEGMSQGIMGMTRSAISFIATPFGLVLAAIALVFAAVKSSMDGGTESADKITKIFTTFSVITDRLMGLLTPLGDYLIDGIAAGFDLAGKAADAAMGFIADGLSFLGFNDAANSVTNFTDKIKNTVAETGNLKAAQEKLAAQMASQEVANEKAKQNIEQLTDIVNDQTKSEKERTDALAKAIVKETQNMNERKKLANEAYNQAVRAAALNKGLTAQELDNLQTQGTAYAEKMMKVKGFTQQEIDALKTAQVEKMRIGGEETKMLENQEAAQQKIKQDAAAKRDAAQQKRQQAEDARKQKAQQALQDDVERQTLELTIFVANQGIKAKTMQEELELAEQIATRKKKIADAELAAAKDVPNAKLKHELAYAEITNELAAKQAAAAVEYANKEVQDYVVKAQGILATDVFLSDELYNNKVQNLTDIAAAEKADQDAKLAQKLISKSQHDAAIKAIEDANTAKLNELNVQKEEADKGKAATDLENQRALGTANMDYNLQAQLTDLDARKQQELDAAEKTGADKSIIEAKYAKEEKAIRADVMDNKLSLANSTFSSLQGILGKESAAGKAMAVAQATIDTYKSAVSAYSSMSGIPVVGPVLGAVAAGAAVAAGIANVKKITSTKTPKAQKGALFNIGGNLHSNGGTMFTGADGTRFEAEKGELIGVMNRNAAAHFMAFNNAFPAGGGSAPNYFANGGIVSREIASPGLNIDELASKIALANSTIPAPVVAVQDIITQGNSFVQVRDAANF